MSLGANVNIQVGYVYINFCVLFLNDAPVMVQDSHKLAYVAILLAPVLTIKLAVRIFISLH